MSHFTDRVEVDGKQYQVTVDNRNLPTAYVWWLFAGFFGAHHFYLGNFKTGLLYACTAGLFGMGWLADFVNLPSAVQAARYRGLSD